jgi:signal transduction histidine kinase
LSNQEREQRQLAEALAKAALVLNKSLKLDEVLAHILEQVKEVIPYQFADITLWEGQTFFDASHRGIMNWPVNLSGAENRFRLSDFPLFKQMVETGQPLLIPDTNLEPKWVMVNGLEWSRSFLSVPLLVEEQVIGFVNLFAGQPDYFSLAMCDRLVAFAAQATVAIQNAWLFEQVRASSERLHSLSRRLVEIQESERLYISRELHDEAGQILTSMMLNLRLLEKEASQPDIVIQHVAKLEQSLNEVLENLHRVAMALRPASLDHLGLIAALRQHVESIGEKHGLAVSFRSGKVQERLPANVETVLYRIVQEALTNIVRHAGATRMDVALTVRDHTLVVIIEDDGIGFDPEAVSSEEHLGLFGMRERAEMIDGKLTIESAPGKGTTIMLEVGYANSNPDRG